jgi:class II lanthipeptide synthase
VTAGPAAPSALEAVREIGRNAISLDEALASHAADSDASRRVSSRNREAAAEALRLWCHAFSRGDGEAFRRRLAWDGLTEDEVRRAFESVLQGPPPVPVEGAVVPRWLGTLAAVICSLADRGSALDAADAGPVSAGDEPPLPFGEVWEPFLDHARTELHALAGAYLPLLDAGAITDLESHLLRQLSEVGAPVINARFARFQAQAAPALPSADGKRPPNQRLYTVFVEQLLAGGLIEVLGRYPVLGRQLSWLTRTWIAGTAELIQRLAIDIDDIAEVFKAGAPTGLLTHVVPGMSDRHRGGRQVALLHFESGLRLVYKPRDLAMEAAYNGILSWLAVEGLEPCPPALAVLPRPGYGWVELVRQQPARTSLEARTYFRRAGALLCTAWVLGGRDLHMENVVATRRGPVLVDVEALIQPPQSSSNPASEAGTPGEKESFLTTGLLSFPQVGVDGGVHDVGGLCGTGGRPTSSRQRDWVDVNTDSMRLVAGVGQTPDADNLLLFDGEIEPPENHIGELAAGFAHAYRFLIEQRERLLDPAGPLAPFATARTRLVLRPSNLYARVLLELTSPKLQRSGLTASFAVDSLNHVFRSELERPRLWPLAAEERQALFDLDVPLFTVPVSSAVVTSRSGEPIHDHLADSGLGAVHARLRGLDEADLGCQLQLLRQTLASPPTTGGRDPRKHRGAGDADRFLSTAESIAERMSETPLGGDDGARCDLYDGCAGTVLFYAGLAAITESERWREQTLRAVQPIARALDESDLQRLAPGGAIGICSGLGGIVYACSVAARLVHDDHLAGLARGAAQLLTDELIAGDTVLDVEGGSAGAILSLLAAADGAADDVWAERAEACARHLLAAGRPAPGGGIGWPDRDGLMLAGFAHGAAGIACSLARLFARTAEPALREAVLLAQAYERTLYSATEGNWPVLRPTTPSKPPERLYMSAWCHGAPGIALARLCALRSVPDVAARNDLEVALDSTIRSPFSGPDHLCCGNLGRVDVILTVGRSLGRADLVAQAWVRAAAVVRRAVVAGAFGVAYRDQQSTSSRPGFFQGTAGIGYQLLRVTSPESLPSVLCFAAPGREAHEGTLP